MGASSGPAGPKLYKEDIVASSGAVGPTMLVRRDDALSTLSEADGDWVALRATSKGSLWVELESSITVGNVTNAGTFAVQEDGAALTALQIIDNIVLAEDSLHVSGDSGVMMLAVRQDAQASLAADGDYIPLTINASGELRVTTGAGTSYTQDVASADPATAATFLMVRDDVLSTQETADNDWTLPRANARGAQWVEIDSTNALDVSAATVTVAGTVTANLSAVDNAVLDQIEVNTSYGDSVGGGTEAAALRVTIANNSTGVLSIDDNAGSITIDNADITSIKTAVELIDDAIATDDTTTHATGTTKGISIMAAATPTDAAVAANDIGSLAMSLDRRLLVDADITASVALDVSAATLTVNAHSVTNAGTFVTQVDGAALTALQLIDNIVTLGAGTEAGVLRVTLANDSTGVLSVDDNGGSLTIDNADITSIKTAVETIDNAIAGSEMQVDLVGAVPAGTNLIGDVGIGVRTSGGTTLYKNIDVDQTEDEIKGTAGQIYWMHVMNLKASVLFLKFYNATAANVTVGTTVPDLTFPIPTQGDTNGAGYVLPIPNGIVFSTAITIACTTGIADADAGAPGVNECVVNAGYA